MNEQDDLTIRPVVNGWVIEVGGTGAPNDSVYVYTAPLELAAHVKAWAEARVTKANGKPASKA